MDTRLPGRPAVNLLAMAHPALVGVGMVLGAAVLGLAVVSAGDGSGIQTLAIGSIALLAIGTVICLALDIPVIGFVRFGFIASFFFKSDMTIFKVDEIEDPSGLNISLTLITAVVLMIYDYIADKERENVFPTSFSILILGLFLCAALSVIYGGPTLLGGFSLIALLTSILIAYATASHFGRRDRILQLIGGIGVGVAFTGIIAFTQYMFGFPMDLAFLGTGTEEEQLGTQSVLFARVPGFLRTPSGMGWVMSTLVPLVLAPVICRVMTLTFIQRLLLIAAALLGTIGVILSLARGSWIGLATAIALMIAFGWFRLSQTERRGYFVHAGGALLLSCALLSPFAGRIYDRLTEDDQGAAAIRLPLLENALLMIEHNPFVGVGLNGYRSNMTKYDETGIFVSQTFPAPVHNIFAHVTTEIGIPGGIIFCLLILLLLTESIKTMTRHDRLLFALGLGTAVALIAFVISGVKEVGSLGSIRPPMRTCFFLFGTILAVIRIRKTLTFERSNPAYSR